MKQVKWSEEDVQKLIEIVKDHEILWNESHPSFENGSAKNRAWKQVLQRIPEYTYYQAKDKFRRVLKGYKVELKAKQGADAKGQIYSPKTSSFETMYKYFQHIQTTPRRKGPRLGNNFKRKKKKVEMDDEFNEFEDFVELKVEENETANISSNRNEGQLIQENFSSDYALPEVQILRKILVTPQSSHRNSSGTVNTLSERRKKNRRDILSRVDPTAEQAFEAFGQSVALQLKQLSFFRGMEVQMKIQTLLTEELIKDREESS